MPALIPPSVLRSGKTPDIIEARDMGWDLQVRGRVREHLHHFASNYMPEGSYSEIYDSPDKDYTVRFYCTREDFAEGMANAARAIDYTKFKDTSNRFPWGKKYHDLLIRIWSASTSLNPAGGFYGPRSKDNPRGYNPASRYKRGNPRNRPQESTSTLWEDLHDPYAEGGVDDLPMALTSGEHRRKSIHDLTDADLEEMWSSG